MCKVKVSFGLKQRAKKVMSDSPAPVDFAIGLVNSVFNLPNRQVNFFLGHLNYRRTVINSAHKSFLSSQLSL